MSRCGKLMSLTLILALGALLSVGVAGCNTVEGAGEDIEAAGDGISDTARDAKD
jgi:predicted small secreted protein